MYKLGIGADGYHLGTQFLEFFILLCQSSKLGGSDKSKISGIEKENRPFPIFFKLF